MAETTHTADAAAACGTSGCPPAWRGRYQAAERRDLRCRGRPKAGQSSLRQSRKRNSPIAILTAAFPDPCAGRSRRLTQAGGPLLNCSIKTPCSTWETDMKLSVAVIIILSTVLLYPSRGFSQQAAGSPQPGAASAGRAAQPFAPFLSQQRGTRITIIGAPASQPSRGLGIECSPVEQGIAGLIIGPTDLCDR